MDFDKIRGLFSAVAEKQEILTLLDHAIEAEGIQILIGHESGKKGLTDWSIVTKAYSIGGEILGSLGVIGPSRMPYERVISVVDATANRLSATLSLSPNSYTGEQIN